jgi:probable rRNA maturation factor
MVTVEIAKNFRRIDVSLPRLKKLVRAVCTHFGLSNMTVSIAVVGDSQFRKLNAYFLQSSRTSDCLSFDLSDNIPVEAPRLFEIVVNGEMAVTQAALRDHSAEAELALYITHGLLHNLGFDDSTRKESRKMHKTEDEILQRFGYGPVYNGMSQKQ